MAIEKKQNPGGRFEATSYLNSTANSAYSLEKGAKLAEQQRPPGFLFFSMTMGANYSFELISIETYAPQ